MIEAAERERREPDVHRAEQRPEHEEERRGATECEHRGDVRPPGVRVPPPPLPTSHRRGAPESRNPAGFRRTRVPGGTPGTREVPALRRRGRHCSGPVGGEKTGRWGAAPRLFHCVPSVDSSSRIRNNRHAVSVA